jgi:hypothetical protein
MAKPRKSPYHHLIPEVREQRRRRNWYLLLAFSGMVLVWILYAIRTREGQFAGQSGRPSGVWERIQRAMGQSD